MGLKKRSKVWYEGGAGGASGKILSLKRYVEGIMDSLRGKTKSEEKKAWLERELTRTQEKLSQLELKGTK